MRNDHLVIPDSHVKPGVDLEFLELIGKFIVERQPSTIIHIGDFADMPSLSSYDVGKRSAEDMRYQKDIDAAQEGMKVLLTPLYEYNQKKRRNKERQYQPRMILCLGNHEERINRATEIDPKLHGKLSMADLGYEDWGWEVYPFLEVVEVDGVSYSHYHTSGAMGRPCSSAASMLKSKHCSCVMGHVQERDIAYARKANGKPLTGLFVGTSYEHEERYLRGPGNYHFRGVWILRNVKDGEFEVEPYTIAELRERYASS